MKPYETIGKCKICGGNLTSSHRCPLYMAEMSSLRRTLQDKIKKECEGMPDEQIEKMGVDLERKAVEYFSERHVSLNTGHNRHLFAAGFVRGYKLGTKT